MKLGKQIRTVTVEPLVLPKKEVEERKPCVLPTTPSR